MTAADIRGLITDELGEQLHALAFDVAQGQAIVELGSFEGKSTAYLAAGALEAGRCVPVYAVDLWDDERNVSGKHHFTDPAHRERFIDNLVDAGLAGHVTAVQADTVEAAKRYDGAPVGLLYIDADHREAAVRQDLQAWRRHLAPGAVVAFDDYGTKKNPGVKRVVDRLRLPTTVVAERLAVVRMP